ncbi:MAG: 50S ribosomal protein L13 [Candidatus Binatia bacterium]
MKSTAMLTREEALEARRWYVIDARDKVLGRVASEAAKLLRGKGKPGFTPHVDCGDFVVIVNAEHVKLTGPKASGKVYYRHSGFPGGIRSRTAEELRNEHPDRILRFAIEGMLPKNRLGRKLATKLKIYAGADHPHAAQQPMVVDVQHASRQ